MSYCTHCTHCNADLAQRIAARVEKIRLSLDPREDPITIDGRVREKSAMKIFGVDDDTLRRWRDEYGDALPCGRVGGRWFWDLHGIAEMIEKEFSGKPANTRKTR